MCCCWTSCVPRTRARAVRCVSVVTRTCYTSTRRVTTVTAVTVTPETIITLREVREVTQSNSVNHWIKLSLWSQSKAQKPGGDYVHKRGGETSWWERWWRDGLALWRWEINKLTWWSIFKTDWRDSGGQIKRPLDEKNKHSNNIYQTKSIRF